MRLQLGSFYRHKKTGDGYVCQGESSADNYITRLTDFEHRIHILVGDIFTLETVFEFISEKEPMDYAKVMPTNPNPFRCRRIDSSIALRELDLI